MQTSLVLPFQTSSTSRLSSNKQKAVFVRQRLVGLDKANDLLLFLFGQSWHEVAPFSLFFVTLFSEVEDRQDPSPLAGPVNKFF